MTVKIDFLISPAYCVPPTRTSRSAKFSTMKTSDRVPSTSGSAWKPGALSTTNWGSWERSSSCEARMNMLRANRLCHAVSVMTRIGTRNSGSAPAKQSCTNRSLP